MACISHFIVKNPCGFFHNLSGDRVINYRAIARYALRVIKTPITHKHSLTSLAAFYRLKIV